MLFETLINFQAANIKVPIDKRVIEHVNRLVEDGVFNTQEMKRHVRIFVKGLFSQSALPSQTNRRFYPSRLDLRQMIYRKRRRIQRGLLDQDDLAAKLKQWEVEKPLDSCYFRPSSCFEKPAVEDEDGDFGVLKMTEETLLFVYQTSWQKSLLHKYGQDTVFLDATYKTTKCALPLFFFVSTPIVVT